MKVCHRPHSANCPPIERETLPYRELYSAEGRAATHAGRKGGHCVGWRGLTGTLTDPQEVEGKAFCASRTQAQ